MEVRENGPSKMPPPTAMDRIVVAQRFACPTNWWASCYCYFRSQSLLFLFLLLDEVVAYRAVFVIVSGSDRQTVETLLEAAK